LGAEFYREISKETGEAFSENISVQRKVFLSWFNHRRITVSAAKKYWQRDNRISAFLKGLLGKFEASRQAAKINRTG